MPPPPLIDGVVVEHWALDGDQPGAGDCNLLTVSSTYLGLLPPSWLWDILLSSTLKMEIERRMTSMTRCVLMTERCNSSWTNWTWSNRPQNAHLPRIQSADICKQEERGKIMRFLKLGKFHRQLEGEKTIRLVQAVLLVSNTYFDKCLIWGLYWIGVKIHFDTLEFVILTIHLLFLKWELQEMQFTWVDCSPNVH